MMIFLDLFNTKCNFFIYLQGLKVQNILQQSLEIHRDIATSMMELGFHRTRLDKAVVGKNVPLFPIKRGSQGYLGDASLLGRYKNNDFCVKK